jgi:hypothetical protein
MVQVETLIRVSTCTIFSFPALVLRRVGGVYSLQIAMLIFCQAVVCFFGLHYNFNRSIIVFYFNR